MATIDASAVIHPTAIVADGAVVGAETSVGPYSLIGAQVVLGRKNRVAGHVVLEGHTRIGDENQIFQFASIGAVPQDLKYKGEDSLLEIGSRNSIREYVTLQPGTAGGGMVTRIGSGNLFMACAHVGHDSIIGDGNVFANNVALGGHVTVGDQAVVGAFCGIHQFVRIGNLVMLGAGSMVHKDVPPFCIAQGDRAGLVGINRVGLQRRGYSAEAVRSVHRLFRELFYSAGLFRERLAKARGEFEDDQPAKVFFDFIAGSQRGVLGLRRKAGGEEAA